MNTYLKAGALSLGLAFATQTAYAGAPAPEITPERMESISLCFDKVDSLLDQADTRQEYSNSYYFEGKDAKENSSSILTALATGNYEQEAEMASLLGQHTSLIAFSMVDMRVSACALRADENGDLPYDSVDALTDYMNALVNADEKLLAIMKKLKAAGDDLIANGAQPLDISTANVYLFR